MGTKEVIGHIDCPICGFVHMQIKQDKNETAYGHCTDCNAQLFTRNAHRDACLRKRMRPVTVTVPGSGPDDKAPPPAAPVTVPVFIPKAAPAPAKAKAAPQAPPAAPAAPAQKAGWFTPIMGRA